MSDLAILYSFRRCPYAMRARLAIQKSGLTCELREVVFRDKPEHMLEKSPKGTVPVMILQDGAVLEESRDIMEFVLAENDPDNWLKPAVANIEEMRTLVDRSDEEFKEALDRYKYPNRYDGTDAEEERTKASEFMFQLESRLEKQLFLFGADPSYADMAILPFVRQFAHVDKDWFWSQDWPKIIGWLEWFLAWPEFTSIMKKYPQWKEGDQETVFPNFTDPL